MAPLLVMGWVSSRLKEERKGKKKKASLESLLLFPERYKGEAGRRMRLKHHLLACLLAWLLAHHCFSVWDLDA